MKFFKLKHKCYLDDIEVNLYEKVKGTQEPFPGNTLAFTAVSYAICEIRCKACGRELRRSIEIIGSRNGFEQENRDRLKRIVASQLFKPQAPT